MENSPWDHDKWKEIFRVYGHAKALFLLAEEMDSLRQPARDFLQPAMEIRHAFDHLMRASDGECSEAAADKNIDKALGHVYRSFFDAADWICMSLRGWVIETLGEFSAKAIQMACPQYYETIRPDIDHVSREIAGLRTC